MLYDLKSANNTITFGYQGNPSSLIVDILPWEEPSGVTNHRNSDNTMSLWWQTTNFELINAPRLEIWDYSLTRDLGLFSSLYFIEFYEFYIFGS